LSWGIDVDGAECPIGCEVCVEKTPFGTTDYKAGCEKCLRKYTMDDGTCAR